MKRIVIALGKLNAGIAGLAIAAVALQGQIFTKLYNFPYTGGALSEGPLVQGTDGTLYGTTVFGGLKNDGTIFRIIPSGGLKTVHSFCIQSGCADGISPAAGLVLATDGTFYGTTEAGGAYGNGTVFRFTPTSQDGKLTTLYSFCAQGAPNCPDGLVPHGLMQASSGDLYGTTYEGGGGNCGTYGCGTVFKITRIGALTTLYRFCAQSGCPDGSLPVGSLAVGFNGDLYGATYSGGVNNGGTVFKITPNGTFTTVSLCDSSGCPYGRGPSAGLSRGVDGNFFGIAVTGGANNAGTIFKLTSGTLSLLYSFCVQTGCADGGSPAAALVQGTDGNFYGTASLGGAYSSGTILTITPSGAFTTLYTFCPAYPACYDGRTPGVALVQATNGAFYGTAEGGMCNTGCGTLFRLSVGLPPFVKDLPDFGKVEDAVSILGSDLTGATSVTFNGTPAAFTIVSPTQITTTVPVGAVTGKVRVTTRGGTLVSRSPFLVLP